MGFKRVTLFIFTLLLIGEWVKAQTPHFRTYTLQDGLPQTSTYDLLLDQSAHIWVGTQGGVACFNGNSFQVYTQEEGLGGNHVTAIHQGADGQIWVGHRYTGISYLDVVTNTFINIASDTVKQVNSIYQYSKNQLLVGTATGIFLINPSEQKVLWHGLKNENIIKVFNQSGKIGFLSNQGWRILDLTTEQPTASPFVSPSDLGLAGNFRAIDFSSENMAWLITATELVAVKIGENAVDLMKKFSNTDFPNLQNLTALKSATDGSVWVGTLKGASRIIDNRIEDFTTANGLASAQISSITEDHEGQIWLGGNFGNGLSLFLGRYFELINQNLTSNITMAVTKDAEGGLWLATFNELVRYTFTNSSESNIANMEIIPVPNGAGVSSLYQDSRGLIWIGFTGGVASYNLKTKRLKNHTALLPQTNRPVISISEDKNGHIWLSLFRNSCYRLNISGENVNSADRFTTNNGLVSNVIWKIYRDKSGNLWFGSNDNGASKYDGSNFQSFTTAEGFPHNRPAAITEDASGNVWFASIGGGIFSYDGTAYKVYTTKEGIDSNNPYCIQGDNLGNIWIGTNKGLNRLNTANDKVDKYSFEEGFIGMETNQNANYKDKNGNLWFGTVGGVMKCVPAAFKKNKVPPPISLEKVQLFLRDVIQIANQELTYDKNHITFHFTGISYKAPKGVRYQYKLGGFEDSWSPAVISNFATYTSLPSGNYNFQVRAINADNIISDKPVEVSFQITPPIWETNWFRAIALLLLVALAYGLHHLRMKKITQDKVKLELLVEERTKEVVAQKEEIQSYNDSLVEKNAEVLQQKEEILTQRDDILEKAEQLSVFYKESSNQNKKIGQSIRYAERIQKAMLPSEKAITKFFPESFILYNPKDVVSGDSYWIGEIDDITLIAAIDCTGHGVPGAIMTMAANLALSQIVNAEKLWKPNEILSRLHILIRQTLAQAESDIRDGMDLALCAIDQKHKQLYFSGAKRPLLVVENGQLQSLSGDRFSIGGRKTAIEFTEQLLSYNENMLFYLTSDGYQDQFGSLEKRKIGRKRFYKLLKSIAHLPLPEQKIRLQEFIDKWQSAGNEKQIDDQVIVCFRLS